MSQLCILGMFCPRTNISDRQKSAIEDPGPYIGRPRDPFVQTKEAPGYFSLSPSLEKSV